MAQKDLFNNDEKGRFEMLSKNGYNVYDVVSALQKSIRRGDTDEAVWWTYELFPKYHQFFWKRILTVAVEDVFDPMGIVVANSCCQSYDYINDGKKTDDHKGLLLMIKTAIFLSRAEKSRETDHAGYYIRQLYDDKKLRPIPEYAFDVHTLRGKRMGKTKKDFLETEKDILVPKTKTKDEFFSKINFDKKI